LGETWGEKILAAGIGAAAGFGGLLLLAWTGKMIWKKEALGGGDIKFMGALGLFVGWRGVLATLMLGSCAGLVFAALLMARGRYERRSYIPFGPFLAAGAFAYWLFSGAVNRLFFL
jgi:leader peptidase (prepilin peptidase)/N-methyltransferase